MEKEPIACKNMAYVKIVSHLRTELDGSSETYKVASSKVVSRHGDDLTNHGDDGTSHDVETALLGSATVPRVGDGKDTGHEVWWRGEEKGFNAGEAESLDNRWEEVCGRMC